MKQALVKYILPWLAYLFLHVWCRTLRVSNLSPENEAYFNNLSGRYIMTHWHSRIFFLLFYFRGRKDWNILVSPSRDAEVLARLGTLLGYTVVRGSSYKNTLAASKELLKALNRDERVVVVADGSRGPRHVAQVGSIQMAVEGRVRVPPVRAHHRRAAHSHDLRRPAAPRVQFLGPFCPAPSFFQGHPQFWHPHHP